MHAFSNRAHTRDLRAPPPFKIRCLVLQKVAILPARQNFPSLFAKICRRRPLTSDALSFLSSPDFSNETPPSPLNDGDDRNGGGVKIGVRVGVVANATSLSVVDLTNCLSVRCRLQSAAVLVQHFQVTFIRTREEQGSSFKRGPEAPPSTPHAPNLSLMERFDVFWQVGEGLHGDHRYRRFRDDVSTHFFPKRFSSKSLFAKIKKFFRSVRIVKIKFLLILASFEKFCLAFTVRSKVLFPALVKPELVLQCLVIFLVNYRGMKSFRFSGCIHVLK